MISELRLFFRILILLISLVMVSHLALSQNFSSISTAWSNDFAEWNLFQGEQEDPIGQIKLRWQLKRDWSEWEFRIGDEIGAIKMVRKDRPDEWEVTGYGKTVNVRTRWPRNTSEWIIADGTKRIVIQSQYRNDGNVWYTPDEAYGYLELNTIWENDPRDWYIIDELSEAVSLEVKIALIFIPIFHSFPRN